MKKFLSVKKLDNWQDVYEEIFVTGFPKEELKPYFLIKKEQDRGFYDVLEFSDDGEPVSYICLWHLESDPNFALIDYFITVPKMRSKGYGSAVLNKLRNMFPGVTLFVECDAVEGDDIEIKSRRMNFYDRNNYRNTGEGVLFFGAHLRILANVPEEKNKEEHLAFLMEKYFGIVKQLGEDIVRKNIIFPYPPK